MNIAHQFIEFSLEQKVLRFGQFITKAGRDSPYFFNAGAFHQGATLMRLATFYAQTLLASGVTFDMLYGPAYKGIPLASATAMQLAANGRDTMFSFNRKEAKDHGEGGNIVGAPLQGRVVIVDDVISAGTSVNESVQIIRRAGATPCAVLIALDRMERSGNATLLGASSAVQEVTKNYGIPVIAIATVKDFLSYLGHSDHAHAIEQYLQKYGVIENR